MSWTKICASVNFQQAPQAILSPSSLYKISTITPHSELLWGLKYNTQNAEAMASISNYSVMEEGTGSMAHLNDEGCKLLLVDCSLINCVRNWKVDHFAETNKQTQVDLLLESIVWRCSSLCRVVSYNAWGSGSIPQNHISGTWRSLYSQYWSMEAEASGHQGHCGLHSKLEASLRHRRSCLKQQSVHLH